MRRVVLQLGGCVLTLCAMGSGGRALAQGTWTQYAGGPDRTSTLLACEFDTSSLASPAWIAQRDSQNRVITFVAQQCPMVSRTHVFAAGSVQTGTGRLWRLYSFDRRTGFPAWEAPIAAAVGDSWSSCAIYERGRSVVIASGQSVSCFNLANGVLKWQQTLPMSIINASPCITTDRGLTNRVFITDFDGAGTGGHLYCINIDQYVPTINPYQPGAIVWSSDLSGTSGNTPAYRDGRVYVTSTGEYQMSPGAIEAFNATSGAPLWRVENDIFEGYYGGIGVRDECGKQFVYASSYGFYGDTWAANTEKIDADSGTRMWSAKSNRSAAIPVALTPSHVIVSGGIQGYGSTPTLQLIAAKAYSATTTWTSLGLSRMGGWSTQPVYDQQHRRLFVGELPQNAGSFGAGIRLHVIDTHALTDNGVLSEQVWSGFGSSPAIAGRNLYCLGAAGLYAFGAAPVNADVNNDGWLDIEDIYEYLWIGGFDVDGNNQINMADFDLLNVMIREPEEAGYMESGRKQ